MLKATNVLANPQIWKSDLPIWKADLRKVYVIVNRVQQNLKYMEKRINFKNYPKYKFCSIKFSSSLPHTYFRLIITT